MRQSLARGYLWPPRVLRRWALLAVSLGPAPSLAADYVLPQPVRVEHLDLNIRLDPESHALAVRATLKLLPLEPRVRSFHLWLHQGFRVDQVRPAHGIRYRWNRQREAPPFAPTARALRFDVARPLLEGRPFTLTLFYRGHLPVPTNGVNQVGPDLVELSLYSGWFPRIVGDDEFDFALTVDVPAAMEVLSYGEPTRHRTGRARRRARFAGRSRSGDLLLLAAPAMRWMEGERDGSRVRLWHPVTEADRAKEVLATVLDLLAFYRHGLGLSRVGEPVVVALTPRAGWSYTRSPLMVLAAGPLARGLDPGVYGGRRNLQLLAHEAGHLWWHLASHYSYDDWLNEALAEFGALEALEERLGPAAARALAGSYLEEVQGLQHLSIGASLRADPEAEQLFYAKGVLVLRLLEQVLGEGAFRALLRDYHRAFAPRGSGAGSTVAFRRLAEQRGGLDLVPFFQPWVYDARLAQFEWDHRLRGPDESGSWWVEGSIRPRAGTPPPPLVPLGVVDPEGHMHLRTVTAGEPEDGFVLPLTFPPQAVILDPEGVIPREEDPGFPPGRRGGEEAALLRRARGLEGRNPSEAEGLYRDVLAAQPEQFYALYRLGRLAARRGDLDVAASYHAEADRVRSGYPGLWGWNLIRLGEIRERQGAVEEARLAYREAGEQPDHLGSRAVASGMLRMIGQPAETRAGS